MVTGWWRACVPSLAAAWHDNTTACDTNHASIISEHKHTPHKWCCRILRPCATGAKSCWCALALGNARKCFFPIPFSAQSLVCVVWPRQPLKCVNMSSTHWRGNHIASSSSLLSGALAMLTTSGLNSARLLCTHANPLARDNLQSSTWMLENESLYRVSSGHYMFWKLFVRRRPLTRVDKVCTKWID